MKGTKVMTSTFENDKIYTLHNFNLKLFLDSSDNFWLSGGYTCEI